VPEVRRVTQSKTLKPLAHPPNHPQAKHRVFNELWNLGRIPGKLANIQMDEPFPEVPHPGPGWTGAGAESK